MYSMYQKPNPQIDQRHVQYISKTQSIGRPEPCTVHIKNIVHGLTQAIYSTTKSILPLEVSVKVQYTSENLRIERPNLCTVELC